MEKAIKMFIETTNGTKLEQNVPEGLVAIYLEKGWKVVEETTIKEPTKTEKKEKSYFGSRKKNK